MPNTPKGDGPDNLMVVRHHPNDSTVRRLSTGGAAKLIREEFGIPCDQIMIRRWIDNGDLPAVLTPTGRHYVLPADVLACVKATA